ncbi:MAG TPA: CHASE domain-containing protein [Vicinamibacterales bacterium]|nr:CHASE domain-containing protein [Vicinamibacterales bacterium]
MRLPLRRLSLQAWIPHAVLAVALSLTFAATTYVVQSVQARDGLRFRAAADETRQRIEIRLSSHIELLRAGAALFGSSANLTGDEFRAFVRSLHVDERYPGVRAIGFAVRASRSQLGAVEAQLALVADAPVRVWPEGARNPYVIVALLEPLDAETRDILGFDLTSDPVLRAALDRARETGEPTASGLLTQPAPPDDGPGFAIVLPVFRRGAGTAFDGPPEPPIGYVFSLYEVGALLEGILADRPLETVDVAVYDGPAPAAPARLYASWPHDPSRGGRGEEIQGLQVAGRPWTVVFVPGPDFRPSFPWLAPVTFLGGVLLSFAFFGVTFVQLRAWSHVRASEEALRRSEARLRDVVEREREARAEAQAANRAKDQFLATLSHELRTPLNAMLGWLSLLDSDRLPPGRRAHALEVIRRNANAQARLIEDLLDVSRILTGRFRVELRPVQVGPIAASVAAGLSPSAQAKGVRLHASIQDGIPNVLGDPVRLQQVIWNLLSNAIKFTPAGGDVYLDVRARPPHVELQVRDTGIGISPEFLPHVFERFRQADGSAQRTHGGVGLGLAIVRHLVELHGGTIEALSEGVNRGARFVVRLPATSKGEPVVRPEPAHGSALQGVRVVLVEDDDETRGLLEEGLSASGASVLSAPSAERALALLRDGAADLLVSDIALPDADGFALMRRVRTAARPGRTGACRRADGGPRRGRQRRLPGPRVEAGADRGAGASLGLAHPAQVTFPSRPLRRAALVARVLR